jgi:hypothetical protein
VSELLTPKLSLIHPGVTVAMPALTTDMDPNTVIVAHTSPAGPLLPSASLWAVVEPISEVKAAISMKPLPILNVANLGTIAVSLLELPIPKK